MRAHILTLLTVYLFCVLFMLPSVARGDWKQDFTRALKNGGAYVERDDGQVLFSHRADDHFIPASTLKIATAAHALTLGDDFRFSTEFYHSSEGVLYVRGLGDPMLVSEELQAAAAQLAREIRWVKGIVLDDSYFAPGTVVDGASHSTNPYDAINGALLANFNTVFFRRLNNGTVQSAEPQTPLTATARSVAAHSGVGEQRINLGADRAQSARYVGELLQVFLEREGVVSEGSIRLGTIPKDARVIYVHRSSKPLTEHLKGMLKFSTNFMANQLFLILGAKKFGAPGTVEKGQRAFREFLDQVVGWSDFSVLEGAGLSRKNRVTPQQMVELLRFFEPRLELLPVEEELFRAKTGSLTEVNTLAGYFKLPDGHAVRFSILVNDQVPFGYKFQLARKLYDGLKGSSRP